MTEEALHYLWKNNLFDALHIRGERVEVLHVGKHNPNDGPDFEVARVRWGGIEWCGAVEIHCDASQWRQHGHDQDPRYEGVVLHVVYRDNAQVYDRSGREIPTAVMEVSPDLLQYIRQLQHPSKRLRCGNHLSILPPNILPDTFTYYATERLIQRELRLREAFGVRSPQEVFYQTLLRYLGVHANNEAMMQVAHSLPYIYIKKHSNDLKALEAMLLGQAGMYASSPRDAYEAQLIEEYRFYAGKFALSSLPPNLFKKLRVRPHNYPARMLAIAAQLMSHEQEILRAIIDRNEAQLRSLLTLAPSEYWCTHYDFGHTTNDGKVMGGIGSATLLSLIINVVVPTSVSYYASLGKGSEVESALEWLGSLPPEQNSIISLFTEQGIVLRSALHTQALLHLYENYCRRGRCLGCLFAANILQQLRHTSMIL